MSTATVSGRVHVIEETKTFGQRGFRKRVVVLEQPGSGRFTNYIPLEFVQDGCDTVDQLNVGDNVEVTYRLNGRKWQRDAQSEVKYFLSAEALSFNVVGQQVGGSPDAPPQPDESEASFDDDDIPF